MAGSAVGRWAKLTAAEADGIKITTKSSDQAKMPRLPRTGGQIKQEVTQMVKIRKTKVKVSLDSPPRFSPL